MSSCHFGSGDIITADDLPRLLEGSCDIEPGAIIRLHYGTDSKDNGNILPRKQTRSQMNNNEASGMAAITPAPAIAPALQVPAVEPAAAAPVAAAPAASTAAPIDVNALTQMTGGNGGIAVVLALIAVAGGTAGWKFWQKLSEQKHELRMKELEMHSHKNKDKSPGQCTAVHAQHEARLAALEGKVSTVEQSSINLDGDFDPADIKKRIIKLEKALSRKEADDE